MLRSALLLVASTALLALASISPAAATDGLPTTCIIDGMVFDVCPLDEDGPPWGGGPGSLTFTKPDLGARGGGFRIAPSCLSPGRTFDAHAVIENFGGLDFRDTPVRIDFYLVHPNTVAFLPGNLLGSQTIIFPHVTSGSLGEVGVLVELSGTLPDVVDGQYQLGIDIDVDDEMLELSENNNREVAGDVVAVGGCVDLVPALDGVSVSSPVTQGETLGITGAVRNEGDAALAGPLSFKVRYRAVPEGGDELGGTVLGQVTVALAAGSSLAPGAVRMAPPLSVETELPPGNYAIGADVDFGGSGDEEGAVDEVDESNNSALVGSVEVNARPPGKPDYVVTKAQITGQEKDPISAGFRFNVAIRLGNLGDNSRPGFYPEVRIVASRDQVIDSSDATLRDFPSARRLFSFGVGNALSQLVTLEVAWPAELPEGKYVIGVVVDPHNQVAEQAEDNNTAIAGGVRAVIDCPHLATLEDAQALYGEVFTRAAPLPVEPATHPGLDGELCEECFTCDLAIFTTELDVCHFDFRYKLANIHVEHFVRPIMHQACVTTLAGLAAARPSAVVTIYEDAKKFKDGLAKDKAFCDSFHADDLNRRYCGCSNTNYLDWAPSPHPGECVYSP